MSLRYDEIIWRNCVIPEEYDTNYEPPKTETRILTAGFRASMQNAPFAADCIWERDTPIRMRDGTMIKVDIFRPKDALPKSVPALLAWSPYGKSACWMGGFDHVSMIHGRVGVREDSLSGYQKFEGPDPAEWIARGYAIVNPDSRGAYDSEGELYHFDPIDAQDGYDVIEYIADLDWCNGSVGMVGNSWLAMSQWSIAAERPPHLKCIAPFEGFSDLYKEILCRGGVPYPTFWQFLSSLLRGRNKQEDILAMLEKFPTYNDYWESKRGRMKQIVIPAYVLASYSTALHTFGSFRGFNEIASAEKWLRVHGTQEWNDFYNQSTIDDLQLFLDHYLKGKDNGWQNTPRVRASFLRYNKPALTNLPFPSYPLPNTMHQTLYLDCLKSTLSPTAPTQLSTQSYQADAPFTQGDSDLDHASELSFTYIFPKATAIMGPATATLYISSPIFSGRNRIEKEGEVDVHVQLRKATSTGVLLRNLNIPAEDLVACESSPDSVALINQNFHLGPSGSLRARFRHVIGYTVDGFPEHDLSQPVSAPFDITVHKKPVVKLEISLWQTGIAFDAGEQLVLKVAGHHMTLAEDDALKGMAPNANVGKHELFSGGEETRSCLVLPIVEGLNF